MQVRKVDRAHRLEIPQSEGMATVLDRRVMRDFGKRLLARRLELYEKTKDKVFQSDEQFAMSIGLTPHQYRHYTAGRSFPKPNALLRICRGLKTTPNDMLLGLEQPENTAKRA